MQSLVLVLVLLYGVRRRVVPAPNEIEEVIESEPNSESSEVRGVTGEDVDVGLLAQLLLLIGALLSDAAAARRRLRTDLGGAGGRNMIEDVMLPGMRSSGPGIGDDGGKGACRFRLTERD